MRAQASFEYMTVVAIVLIIIMPLLAYFYIYTSSSVQISQAQESVRKVANAIEYVASGGPGTRTTVTIQIPSYTSDVFIGNKTVMIKLDVPTGATEVYETVDKPIIGYIKYIPGGVSNVKIINLGDYVQVGEGIIFNPNTLYIALAKGEDGSYDEQITSVLPYHTSLNYSLEGEHTEWVTVSNFPTGIDPDETKTFQLNFSIPTDAQSGEYYMSLISESNLTRDELPIILRVLGLLHNVIIKFYSDPNYVHEVNKFFPGDTVYFKIINLDDGGLELPANTTYNISDPNGNVKYSNSYFADVYEGSYTLDSNWSEVHGIWNLNATSERGLTVSNSSSFEVKASLLMNLNYSCDEVNGPANWWNASWFNRQEITLDSEENVNGMQVKIDVKHQNGMKSNYSDIRFVKDNVELPYFIEKYNSTDAIVWVKVDLTAGENKIYLYFNNSNANSKSNPYSVFDFYDDFSTLNESNWKVITGTQYTISDGILKITRGAFGLNEPLSFDFRDGYILEANVSYNSYAEPGYSGDLQVCSSNFVASGNANSDSVILYMVDIGRNRRKVKTWVGSGATNSYDVASGERIFTSNKNVWYLLGISVNSTGVSLWKDGEIEKSHGVNWIKEMNKISIGSFYGDGYHNIKDTSYDWIRIRKYAKQPAVSFGNITKLSDPVECIVNWWNGSWQYRRWVDIIDTTGTDRINLPVRISLNGSNIDFSKTDGDDIRVIFEGEKIPYWVESWDDGAETAVIWVKLPYLNASSKSRVWIYYGNPSATSESNKSAVFFVDDMENGDGKWIYNGLWHITTRRSNSPAHSFWYGQESTGDYDTGSANSGYLETKDWIQLYDNPVLYYWQFRETEEYPGYDLTYVQISTDNSTWITLDNSYNNDPGSVKSIDLSSYANQKVLIRFYFDTVDSLYNYYEGWFIDDVNITDKANVDVNVESDAFSERNESKISWHLLPLDQFDNSKIGSITYQLYLNDTLYDEKTETTDDMYGEIVVNSSVVGNWTLKGIWNDIYLTNVTYFVVKYE